MFSQLFRFVGAYWFQVLLVIIVGYLLGSLNTPIILTKKLKNGADIRSMGSGNAGLTNVMRCNGKLAGLIIVVVDLLKVIIAINLTTLYFSKLTVPGIDQIYIIHFGKYLMGISCFIGHLYPCFFNFKGGKGVLFAISMILAIDYRVGIILLIIFAIVVLTFKMVSLGSIVSAFCYPIATFLITYFIDYFSGKFSLNYVILVTISSGIIGLIVILKHKKNIIRIYNKTESKLKFSKG